MPAQYFDASKDELNAARLSQIGQNGIFCPKWFKISSIGCSLMSNVPANQPQQRKAVQFFARSICKAIARFGVLFSVPVSEVMQALREAYVEVAADELKRLGQEPTDSRIALMTGLPRKSIPVARTPKACWETIPFTNLLGYWGRTKRYLDSNGDPAELPLTAHDEPSFADLVHEFCGKHFSVKSIAEFLEKSGNIELTDYGTVRLISTWATDEDLELAITFGANALAWHADTTIENLRILSRNEDKDDRLPDRKRYSRAIPAHLIPVLKPQFDKIFRDADKVLAEIIDDAEVSQEALDSCLFGAGWFLFRQPPSSK